MAKTKSAKKKTLAEQFPEPVDLRSPEAIKEWEDNEAAMQADKELHDRKRAEDRKRQQFAYSNYANNITHESKGSSKPVRNRVSKKA